MEASRRRRPALATSGIGSRTLLALGSLLLACGGDKASTPDAPPIGKLLAALLGAADTTTEPWRCAAGDVPGNAEADLVTGERTWKLAGHTLRRTSSDTEIVIGVVADAAGAAPRTVAALGRIRAAFDAAKADVVLSLGGMGTAADELEATLGTLSDRAPWPVVALPGDLEAMPAHVAAITALRTRGDTVLDGRSIRWLELGPVTIGTVPGGGAIERLAAGADGCAWTADDVVKLVTALTAKTGIRVVASSEAPRVKVGGEAAGALALAPSKALPIEIALHGPVTPVPSAARTGGRDGAGVALSPGTVDATARLPHAHRPSAGVLTVRGGVWSWRPIVDAKPPAT